MRSPIADEATELTTCPRCEGRIHGTALACGPGGSSVIQTTCDFCNGTGKVTAYYESMWRTSERLRQLRIACGMTAREAARAYSEATGQIITLSDWSNLEHGRAKNLVEIDDARIWLEDQR